MPKVSVIIPIYGVEKYIERCARSLFDQTLDDIEYLFVDDCTPDDSIGVLKRVLDEYPHRKHQVKIHQMSQNSGQAKVREWGMKNAMGEYVIHCDSDDWVDVNMYQDMYEKAKERGADVVLCDYYVSNTNSFSKAYKGCKKEDAYDLINEILFQRIHASLWNKLFRRELISEKLVYPKGNLWEDMAIVIQLLPRCSKLSYLGNPYYYYYQNESSIINDRNKDKNKEISKFLSERDNLNLIIKALIDFSIYDRYYENINNLKFHTLHLLFPYSNDKECYKMMLGTYPNMIMSFLLLKNVSFRYKISYILALLHVYPYVWKFFTKRHKV